MEPAIGDYGIIGDCRSAALISRDGSLDWLCWPRFDSPSLFAALLDREHGGSFVVRPSDPAETSRRYLGSTNVLETTHRTPQGILRVRDLMPAASEREKARELWPDHQVMRAIECVDGEVQVDIHCDPRPNYGGEIPAWRARGRYGFASADHAGTIFVAGDVPLLPGDAPGLHARVTLRRGERRYASILYSQGEPATMPAIGEGAERRITLTLDWWTRWADRCGYEGPWRDAVVRSALLLKLLTFAPSGAVIAAPTTSLPEQPGGTRNWDYRYCWLRDASLTLQALFDLGYDREASAYMSWLLHTTRLTRPELGILYDVYGGEPPRETTLDHLRGYADSRPVRVGNSAKDQLQLDVYGEVVDALYEYVQRGGILDRGTVRMVVGFGEVACRKWCEADNGIWEIRSDVQHHTHSRVMCWVALDRLIRLHEEGHVRVPIEKFRRNRDAIVQEVEARGWNPDLGSYVSTLDGRDLDAVLLRLGRFGYLDPRSARMRSTCRVIHEKLGTGPLLYRYLGQEDGLPPGEGAFGICSFWGVTAQALEGNEEAAAERLDRLLAYGNDLGLFSEEVDPATGMALGNFPQAFTHVGLIDAVLSIQQAREGREERRKGGRARTEKEEL